MFFIKFIILFAFCSIKIAADRRFSFGIIKPSDTNLFGRIKTESLAAVPEVSCDEMNDEMITSVPNSRIQICFNTAKAEAYYAYHQILKPTGVEQKACWTGNKDSNYYPGDFDPKNAYDNLPQTLKTLLDSTTSQNILNKNGIIHRGHLAAAADFCEKGNTCPDGKLTYHYINAVPQWSTLNNGIWKSVERSVRSYARTYNTLDIYTGTYGVLEYSDVNNNNVPIYLEPSRNLLSIPKFIWKIVQDAENKLGIAFISYNDRYIDASTVEDWPCKELLNCKDNKWNIHTSKENAVVQCCRIKNLLPYIPHVIADEGILQGDGTYTDCDVPNSCDEEDDDGTDNCQSHWQ